MATTIATVPSTIYSWDVWYRHESETDRSVRTLPQMSCRSFGTIEAREEDIVTSCADLRRQGYEIQKIERTEACARCAGSGKVPGKKFMQYVPCPSCQSEAIATLAKAKRTKANAAAKARRDVYRDLGMKRTPYGYE